MYNESKIFYRSLDGLKLCGVLSIPKNPKGFILMVHGITMDKSEYNNFYVELSKQLYKKSFASFRFDFRAHGESKGIQRETTVIGELLDIKATVKKIKKYWSGPISIVAASFGASISIIYTAQNSHNVNSLILLWPVVDYGTTFLKPETPWAKKFFNEEKFENLEKKGFVLLNDKFEVGYKMIEEFKLIKPYKYLKKITCPVLTIHGDRDSIVPYEISKKYCLPNSNSKFITLKGADHGFVTYGDTTGKNKKSQENKKFVISEIVKWVREWN